MSERFFPVDRPVLQHVVDWSAERIVGGPDPTNGARSAAALESDLAGSICAQGIGGIEALRRFTDVIVPATRAQDAPMNFAYVPAAPTPAALTFDLAVSAAEIFAGTWETGAGAIAAENQALRWLGSLAGLPSGQDLGSGAGGTFVSGGTIGNLSALHAARERARLRDPSVTAWRLAASESAHSSIASAAKVMDVEVLWVPGDEQGRLEAAALEQALGDSSDIFAVLATAGTTNAGLIDDLVGIGSLCQSRQIWMHVDGALGLSALASPTARRRFDGIELADSFVVDPHKWLFAPYDCCALVYREPENACAAHSQVAPYLDQVDRDEWNPADYAIHLSRRARGLPLWFSLASHGTSLYAAAIDRVLSTVAQIRDGIVRSTELELVLEPDLNVILFRRPAYSDDEMLAWSDSHRRAGTILCLPTTFRGEMVFRLCLVNPDTQAQPVLDMLQTGLVG